MADSVMLTTTVDLEFDEVEHRRYGRGWYLRDLANERLSRAYASADAARTAFKDSRINWADGRDDDHPAPTLRVVH